MDAKGDMMLVTTDTRVVEEVAAATRAGDHPCGDWCVCRSVGELGSRLSQRRAEAALVDIDPQPAVMLQELGTVAARFPNVRLVVMAGEMRNDLLLGAMHIGARHFLVKNAIQSDMSAVLEKIKPARSAPAAMGDIITVLSAGGGSGATTLAINLAHELGVSAGSPSLLVDMDGCYGAVGSYLGLSGEYSVRDVLRPDKRVDDELVVTTAKAFSPKVHVLLSPASVDPLSAEPMECGRIDTAARAFQAAYAHTVVDAARMPMATAARLCGISRVTLLVLQMTVKDLTQGRLMLQCLAQSGVSGDQVAPIINRYHRRNQAITSQDAEKVLGVPARRLSNDFASAMRAMNMAQPLAEAAPRSSLRREIQALASQLMDARHRLGPGGRQ